MTLTCFFIGLLFFFISLLFYFRLHLLLHLHAANPLTPSITRKIKCILLFHLLASDSLTPFAAQQLSSLPPFRDSNFSPSTSSQSFTLCSAIHFILFYKSKNSNFFHCALCYFYFFPVARVSSIDRSDVFCSLSSPDNSCR